MPFCVSLSLSHYFSHYTISTTLHAFLHIRNAYSYNFTSVLVYLHTLFTFCSIFLSYIHTLSHILLTISLKYTFFLTMQLSLSHTLITFSLTAVFLLETYCYSLYPLEILFRTFYSLTLSLSLSLSLSYRHIVSNIATLSYLDKTLSLSLHSLLPPFSHSHSLTLNSFSNSLSYRYTISLCT